MNAVSSISRAFFPVVGVGFSKISKACHKGASTPLSKRTSFPHLFRKAVRDADDFSKEFSKLSLTSNRSGTGGSRQKNSAWKSSFTLFAGATCVLNQDDWERVEVKRLEGNKKEIHAILSYIGFDLSKLDPNILEVFKIAGPTISALDFSQNRYQRIILTPEILKTLAEYFPNIIEINLGNLSRDEVRIDDLLHFKKLEKIILAKDEPAGGESRKVLHIEVAYNQKTSGKRSC